MEGIDYISLIHKSLSMQISRSENELLQKWLDESDENRNEYFEIKLIWDTDIEEEPYIDEETFLANRQTLENNLFKIVNRDRFTAKITRSAFVMMFIGLTTLASGLYLFIKPVLPPSSSFSVASDDHQTITLGDSSLVRTNNNTFVTSTVTPTTRELELNGEAFFDVKKQKRPFIVRSGKATITVKGTSFYIKGYSSMPLEILVISGNVEVSCQGKTWILRKGQYLSLDKGNKSMVSDQPRANFMTWASGKLEFKKTSLKKVIQEIEQYYKIHCTVPAEMEECRFTGTFENTPLTDVFKILSYSLDIHFDQIQNDYYSISGKGCSP